MTTVSSVEPAPAGLSVKQAMLAAIDESVLEAAAVGREHYDYLVVGAGFAGAVMAERLAADGGKRVLIIDRRPHVGGNAYDVKDAAGILIHQYGPHIFHTNSEDVAAYLSQFTKWRPYEHRVLASVKRGLLVPMPITRSRLRERGFNQAAEIARVASRSLRIPCAVRALERTRDAPPQSRLGRRPRLANLRGAFRCRARLHGRHVALVDDVITTGATAHAASQALRRAGAAHVDVWVIARTPRPGEA